MVDTALCRARGIDPLSLAESCLEGGARIIQLRAKEETPTALLALADALVASAARHGAHVIVNDRADVALMSGAAGVHVGQDDLVVADVRAIVGARAVVGVSTHTRGQIDQALREPATYLAVGPVFATSTKQTGYEAVGLPLIRYAAHRGLPVVAIGGLTPERASRVFEAGAASVAVIADLLAARDPSRRVRDYLAVLP